eukprot:12906163-Prorocentrum_lima.AAC.1
MLWGGAWCLASMLAGRATWTPPQTVLTASRSHTGKSWFHGVGQEGSYLTTCRPPRCDESVEVIFYVAPRMPTVAGNSPQPAKKRLISHASIV